MDDSLGLVHWSPTIVRTVRPADQAAEGRYGISLGMKPAGLWISAEGPDQYGWKEWCKDNDFRVTRGAFRFGHAVKLAPDANVLRLDCPEALDAFTLEFSVPMRPGGPLDVIDWGSVAKRWQGILIVPYCWERRLSSHTFWYYGWDCASGCIWDPAAIESINVIKKVKV